MSEDLVVFDASSEVHAARIAADELVHKFLFNALQARASKARIICNGRRVRSEYRVNGKWYRVQDMPISLWPQLLRNVRNRAYLTLGPLPPRQEGTFDMIVIPSNPSVDSEDVIYTLSLIIMHDELNDEIHLTISDPVRRPTQFSPFDMYGYL